jgi:hypothetical protein
MDLGTVFTTDNVRTMVKGTLIEVNLVGQLIKVFTKWVGKHSRLMQTNRRTKLWAFGQAKAWIQTFKG